jgi:hypothetical protein
MTIVSVKNIPSNFIEKPALQPNKKPANPFYYFKPSGFSIKKHFSIVKTIEQLRNFVKYFIACPPSNFISLSKYFHNLEKLTALHSNQQCVE